MKSKYDWAAIQRYHAEGHSLADCRRVFGFSKSSWEAAAKRGEVKYVAPVRSGDMQEKLCPRCERILPIDHFHRKGQQRHSFCKDCQKVLRSNSCYKNRPYYQDKVKERERETNLWLQEYKKGLSCSRCSFSHPAAIQFHHREDGESIRGGT